MPGFRLQGKHFFLTYPRCTLEKEQLLAFLQQKFADNLERYVVSRELHEDGTPHLHCVVSLKRRISSRDTRYLDVEGFHPNIQTCRSVVAAERYVEKDGDVLRSHPAIEEKPSWGDIRDQATSVEDYMRRVEMAYPRDTALNYDRLLSYAQKKFKKEATPYTIEFPDTEWRLPNGVNNWLTNEFPVSCPA